MEIFGSQPTAIEASHVNALKQDFYFLSEMGRDLTR